MSFQLFGFAFLCHINATVKHSILKARHHSRNLLVSLNFFIIFYFSIFLACFFSLPFFSKKYRQDSKNLKGGSNCPDFKIHAFRYEYKFHKTWSWKISYHLLRWTDTRDKRICKVSTRDKGASKAERASYKLSNSKPGSHLSLSLLCGCGGEVQRHVCITNFLA